jgi:hypothetical protein
MVPDTPKLCRSDQIRIHNTAYRHFANPAYLYRSVGYGRQCCESGFSWKHESYIYAIQRLKVVKFIIKTSSSWQYWMFC